MLTIELPKHYAPVARDFERYEVAFREAIGGQSGALAELTAHVSRFRGKQLRPALVFLSARAAGGTVTEDAIRAAVAIELIHTATLVHDDVIDGAEKRRSLPTVNSSWGNETSVLLGDYLFATAYGVAAACEQPLTARTLASATRLICRGEVNQLSQRGNIDLDRDTYFSIIADKTATLYEAAAELGGRLGGGGAEHVAPLAEFGRSLGVAFQIADDVLDLLGDEEDMGKSLGTDLEMGTVTLPILYAMEHASAADRAEIADLLSDGSRTARTRLRDLVEPSGAFDHARAIGRSLVSEAKRALGSLPPSPSLTALAEIGDYVMERKL